MVGVTLSRWTMSYFALALAALLAAEGLMAAGYGYPATSVEAPETRVLIHVVSIGWLSLLMCGALFQFVPVLVARPIYSNWLPLPTLACFIAGLATLILGFLRLGGLVTVDHPFFACAGALLGAGVGLTLWNLGCTLWVARPLPLPARFVTIGLFSFAATATLGIVFAIVHGGMSEQPQLLDLTAIGRPIHVIAGLGGWLSFTAMGVSYRLLAMFMLAPEREGPSTRGALYLGAGALAISILGGVAVIWSGASPAIMLGLGGLLGLASMVLYGGDMLRLYRARRRRSDELNIRMAMLALVSLAATVLLMIGLVGLGELGRHAPAVVFLISFGWLSGLGLAKLYKIVAFLTWLECYGPILGKAQTPRVQDLVVERRATKWFLLYFAAVWSGTALLLLDVPLGFRLAAFVMAIATSGIIVQLVRARRLTDVKGPLRMPDSVRRPWLLTSIPRHA